METENEYEDMRELLRHSSLKTAPAGLDQKIMSGIMAFEYKRKGKQRVWVPLLRLVAVSFLLVLLARVIGPEVNGSVRVRLSLDDVANWAEKSGLAGRWLFEHAYYILPVLLLLVFRKRLGGGQGV